MIRHGKIPLTLVAVSLAKVVVAQTVALWPFDEQKGLYPSSVLSDVGENDYLPRGGDPLERSPCWDILSARGFAAAGCFLLRPLLFFG